MAFNYYCFLKHDNTEIFHCDLPFSFFFSFSSKKKFPTKKYLANYLEIKVFCPYLLSPLSRKGVFFSPHRKQSYFCFYQNLWQRRKLSVQSHTLLLMNIHHLVALQSFQKNNKVNFNRIKIEKNKGRPTDNQKYTV